jgi:hypothetical protein
MWIGGADVWGTSDTCLKTEHSGNILAVTQTEFPAHILGFCLNVANCWQPYQGGLKFRASTSALIGTAHQMLFGRSNGEE